MVKLCKNCGHTIEFGMIGRWLHTANDEDEYKATSLSDIWNKEYVHICFPECDKINKYSKEMYNCNNPEPKEFCSKTCEQYDLWKRAHIKIWKKKHPEEWSLLSPEYKIYLINQQKNWYIEGTETVFEIKNFFKKSWWKFWQ